MKKTVEELNKKTWYRFIKVVFIIVLLFTVHWTWNAFKPYDGTDTYVVCNNGQEYYYSSLSVSLYADYYTNECNGGYVIKDITKTYRSWNDLIKCILIVLVVFEAIRRLFYYIVLGKAYPKIKNS